MTLSFSSTPSQDQSLDLTLSSDPSQTSPTNKSPTFRQLTLVEETQISQDDTFSILVASDLHLGFADRDEMRKMDSLRTFDEVLRTAKEKKVDFVLLGGDLFHHNKPSRFTSQECATLLRRYCMGEGGTSFQLVSRPEVNFAHIDELFRRVNTEDPNLNINLPVYSIHGNHDDPSGLKYLSKLDLLHTYGLINYFGKATNIENIEIFPLLFTKGNTKLAIYGLGSVRDERLHRAYLEKLVKMKRPSEHTAEWFNIFVLHQNRPAVRGSTNYVPESFLEDWLDLVIWGHEHDPIPDPVLNKEMGFEVLQPGSTVATSMSDGEAKQKYCYHLQVCKNRYRVDPIALETVRPFFIEDICLHDKGFVKDLNNADEIRLEVEKYLCKKIERIIKQAAREKRPNQPEEPLVRLRVDFGEIEPLNPILFGQKFFGRVANPRDIIKPQKAKAAGNLSGNNTRSLAEPSTVMVLDTTTIEELVVDHFKTEQLTLLDPRVLTEALRQYVHHEDKEVITDIYTFQKLRIQQYLSQIEMDPETPQLEEQLRKYRSEHENVQQNLNEFTDWRSGSDRSLARFRPKNNGTKSTERLPANVTIEDDDDFANGDVDISLNLGQPTVSTKASRPSVGSVAPAKRVRQGIAVAARMPSTSREMRGLGRGSQGASRQITEFFQRAG